MLQAAIATLYFTAGIAIGLASAAPVGPVNLLVIQRTLTGTVAGGLLLGLAGAVGDALFAAAAAFGVAAVARLIAAHGLLLRLGGGFIMLAFAVAIWRSRPKLRSDDDATPSPRMMLATFTLTVTNPATLLFFVGAFGAVGFVDIGHDSPAHRLHAALVVAGTFTGSMLWWLTLTAIAKRLRGDFTDDHLARLNRITAVALGLFAAAAVATGIDRR